MIFYNKPKRRWPKAVLAVLIAAAVFSAGFLSCRLLAPGTFTEQDVFSEIYSLMKDQWYFGKDDENLNATLFDSIFSGMATQPEDPFSEYFTPDAAGSFYSSLDGAPIGIGIQYLIDGAAQFRVSHVYNGSSAAAAGIRAGDLILFVDGAACAGLPLGAVAEMVSGGEGATHEITFSRGGTPFSVMLTRTKYESDSSLVIDGKTAVLTLYSFSETLGESVKKNLEAAAAAGCTGLLVDLRGNGGGYLDSLMDVADLLFPAGTLICTEEDRYGNKTEFKTADSTEPYSFEKIAVLIDKDSASCAEIFAAALKERLNATLVGETSYGKGTVQSAFQLKNGSTLKMTVARWLTPNGEWIHEKGITPDITVPLPAVLTIVPGKDSGGFSISPASAQRYLAFLGYSDKQDFDADALRTFQREKGLAQTGVLESDTVLALYNASADKWSADRQALDTQLHAALNLFL